MCLTSKWLPFFGDDGDGQILDRRLDFFQAVERQPSRLERRPKRRNAPYGIVHHEMRPIADEQGVEQVGCSAEGVSNRAGFMPEDRHHC